MTARRLIVLLVAAAAALYGFHLFIRQVSLIAFNFAGASEVRALLDESSEDQKRLSRLDPERGAEYRKRFDRIQDVNRKLEVVALNREEIARRYEWTLTAVVAALLLAFIVAAIVSAARRERRLRIQYLDHLATWQEAARRHAHELRTPLTAVRMEVDAFVSAVAREPSLAAAAAQAQVSIHEELDRLREFTRQFTSFGRIAQPRRKLDDVQVVLEEFITLFSGAWPSLTLVFERTTCDCTAALDRELFRQVLVNLCNNSSLAGATRVTFRIAEHRELLHVDVADDGPGVDPSIRPRLFQPYTTTRAVGEGMGLGLAICRKIMLDHDGDLELLDAPGAVFRLTLPKAQRT